MIDFGSLTIAVAVVVVVFLMFNTDEFIKCPRCKHPISQHGFDRKSTADVWSPGGCEHRKTKYEQSVEGWWNYQVYKDCLCPFNQYQARLNARMKKRK